MGIGLEATVQELSSGLVRIGLPERDAELVTRNALKEKNQVSTIWRLATSYPHAFSIDDFLKIPKWPWALSLYELKLRKKNKEFHQMHGETTSSELLAEKIFNLTQRVYNHIHERITLIKEAIKPEVYDIQFASWLKHLPRPTVLASATALSAGTAFIDEAEAAKVTLAWDPNTEPDVRGYNIYSGTDTNDINKKYEEVLHPTTTFSICDLVEGVLYYFEATVHDTVYNESGRSNRVEYKALEPPVITAANQASSTSANLAFLPGNTNRTRFDIYVTKQGGSAVPTSTTCTNTNCNQLISGLTANSSYSFKIVGVQGTDKSADSNSVSLALSSTNTDTITPTLAVNTINKYTNQDSIAISGTASDNLPGLEILVANQKATLTQRPDLGANAFGFNHTTSLPNAYNEILITAKDATGNTANKILLVIKDKTAPVLSVSSPWMTNQNNVTISGTATDNQAVDTVTNQNGQTLAISPNGAFTETLSPPEGQVTRTYRLTDKAGNQTERTISFFSDKTTPKLTTTPPAMSTTGIADVPYTIDDLTGTEFTITDGGNTVFSSSSKTGTATLTLTKEGENSFGLNVTDQAGNIYLSDLKIIRETLPPEVINTSTIDSTPADKHAVIDFFDATKTTATSTQAVGINVTDASGSQDGKVEVRVPFKRHLTAPFNDTLTLTDIVGQTTTPVPYSVPAATNVRRIYFNGFEDYLTQAEVTTKFGSAVTFVEYDKLEAGLKSKVLGDNNMAEGKKALGLNLTDLAPLTGKNFYLKTPAVTTIRKDEKTLVAFYNPLDADILATVSFHIPLKGYISAPATVLPSGWSFMEASVWNATYQAYTALSVDGVNVNLYNPDTNPNSTPISGQVIVDSVLNKLP